MIARLCSLYPKFCKPWKIYSVCLLQPCVPKSYFKDLLSRWLGKKLFAKQNISRAPVMEGGGRDGGYG